MEQKQNISAFSQTRSIQGFPQKSGWNLKINTSNKKTSNKKLKYNFREISTLLLNANKSQTASSVFIMAVDRLAYLRSAAATGQYDKTEVLNAITHANRMVACAKAKVRNLREEETEKQQNDKAEDSLSEMRNKYKKSFKKQQLELKKQQLELKKKCRKHRNEERSQIDAANGAYERNKGRKSSAISLLNASERVVLLELKNLEMKERQEKNHNTGVASGCTNNSGTVVDVTVSTETDASVSVDSSGIDVSI